MQIIKNFMWCGLVLLLCCGCSDQQRANQTRFKQWMQPNDKLKILSTTGMINDVVGQIGGDYVDNITLIQRELDPHSYQLVKGDDEKLAYAQIIFYNGLGLEHGASLHNYLIDNPKAKALGDFIKQRDAAAVINVHGQEDPHIWMDISLWSLAIPMIVQTLSAADPLRSNVYASNGAKLLSEMTAVHEQVRDIMQRVPQEKRYLVTSHDAFNYFTRAYLSEKDELIHGGWEKRFAAPEGLSPDSQLSATDIKIIIVHLKKYQIHLIFPETNVSRDSINKIIQAGQEYGLNIEIACCALYSDSMGAPGSMADTYLKMMVYNAQTLLSHMDSTSAITNTKHIESQF